LEIKISKKFKERRVEMKSKFFILLIGMCLILSLVAVFLVTTPKEALSAEKESGTPKEGVSEPFRGGFLAPLTGDVAPWGLPGLNGVKIWVDAINAEGGIQAGSTKHPVELYTYDDEWIASKSVTGAKKLVLEDNVSIVLQLSGAEARATAPFFTKHQIPSTTLTMVDCSPDAPYLFAAAELFPLAMVGAYHYVAQANPEAKTMAIIEPDSPSGHGGMAIAKAACEAFGIDIVYAGFYLEGTLDFAPVMTAMLAKDPDILNVAEAYPDDMILLMEQAYLQGFDGPIMGSTCDQPDAVIDKTSREFLEGFVYSFPDFDDPSLTPEQNAFYEQYVELYPGTWGAVSWEYAAQLDVYKYGIEKAGTIDPMAAFAAMKSENVPHAFGMGAWWGKDIVGIDNVLMAPWPAVQIQNGKAVIVEMFDLVDWCNEHRASLLKHLADEGQLWWQR
jgi:branched-chain amino acid transport system substrate-binding protein